MPPRRPIELRVGGQTYRVVGSDNDQHVQRLASLVDRKFAEVVPQGRGVTGQQAMFLIAMALAEEAEEQRTRAARLEAERDRSVRLATRAREVVTRLLDRVDSALASLPADTAKQPSPPAAAETRDVRQSLPHDVRQSLPHDVRQSLPHDGRQSLPHDGDERRPRDGDERRPRDARRAPPRDGWQPMLPDAHPSPAAVAPASALSSPPVNPSPIDSLTEPPDVLREHVLIELMPPSTRDPSWSSIPPPSALPAPPGASNETGVPRSPRPGLRLVRRSTSSDDEPR